MPAYFGDHGHAGATQPNYGLDEFFGARERYVEFTPDLLDKLTLEVNGHQINGRYFLQEYETTGGQAAGHYANGHVAAVENQHGKGRTLLIGTFPGQVIIFTIRLKPRRSSRDFLKLGNTEPHLQTNTSSVQARLHSGPGGDYIWVTNPTRKEVAAEITVEAPGPQFHSATDVWTALKMTVNGPKITLTLPARDGAVISLH